MRQPGFCCTLGDDEKLPLFGALVSAWYLETVSKSD
jgi:hypothetical protein